ncbi:MAG: diacylglycerol kinase family lipid kinase [Armatimonadota bacterium]|nr:diacylglycerol kinase family lipid kinase [Armatimonadota bacterium]
MRAVVNPVAGGRRGMQQWKQARPILTEAGWEIRESHSERRGHARQLTAASPEDVVLAVGGDGTANEVANGLLGARRHGIMALLPVGTANDFARALGIPRDPVAAARILVTARPRPIDVGEVNGHYFLTIAGVGFDGEVARQVNAWPKLMNGTVMYAIGILKTLGTYRPVEVELSLDGSSSRERIFLVAAANTAWNAGGMHLAPGARPDDGLLHTLIAGPLGRLETLFVLPKVFSGRHLGHPKVRLVEAREVVVSGPTPLFIQADGEPVGTLPARFCVHPKALLVLAPPAP